MSGSLNSEAVVVAGDLSDAVSSVVRRRKKALKLKSKTRKAEFKDTELVEQARRGSRNAFQMLVEQYQSRAYRLAFNVLRRREDAEDVVQESFVKAYLSLPNFKGESAFYTWFYRIVYNMSVDLKRKTARRGGAPAELDEKLLNIQETNASILIGHVEGPQSSILRKEQAGRIQTALAELSDEHRAVIHLRELDGLSYEEISDILSVSKGTIMSRLHYARKKLQSALRDLVPESELDEVKDLETGQKSTAGV